MLVSLFMGDINGIFSGLSYFFCVYVSTTPEWNYNPWFKKWPWGSIGEWVLGPLPLKWPFKLKIVFWHFALQLKGLKIAHNIYLTAKRLLKLTDSITPYFSTINKILDLKLIHICLQRPLSEIKWKGAIAGILTERNQKQCQPWEKLGTP